MKKYIFLLAIYHSPLVHSAELSNESEVGITVAKGNTDTQNYNIKQGNKLTMGKSLYALTGRFLNGFSQGTENARYLSGNLRYERSLDNRVSVFIAQGLESDKYAGYYLRYLTDAGLKYHFYKQEPFIWFIEAGYRYTDEKRMNGQHDYQNSLRGYTELEKYWSEGVSTKYTLEYVPQLSESKDYLINTELSVSAALTEIFSIKSGYLLRYDNFPVPGIGTKTDTLLTTALVAKF